MKCYQGVIPGMVVSVFKSNHVFQACLAFHCELYGWCARTGVVLLSGGGPGPYQGDNVSLWLDMRVSRPAPSHAGSTDDWETLDNLYTRLNTMYHDRNIHILQYNVFTGGTAPLHQVWYIDLKINQ